METVELKPLSETEEDLAPKDQTDKKTERPESVQMAPKDTREAGQEMPEKPRKKKTRKRDVPDELAKAEETELLPLEEQVCYYFHSTTRLA